MNLEAKNDKTDSKTTKKGFKIVKELVSQFEAITVVRLDKKHYKDCH